MTNLFQHIEQLVADSSEPTDDEFEPEIWKRYGQTVSVLILDSSGFSRVSEQYGILHFLSKLVLMRKIITPVLQKYTDREFKFEADNVYAVFEHPNDAIEAALAAHHAVAESELMLTENEPFKVCIGIGYGELLYSETPEGFFGEEMNLASKLGEDTAEGGETLITSAAYINSQQSLVSSFEPRALEISGIQAPYYRHLYQP
jgi:adenylate cyclase